MYTSPFWHTPADKTDVEVYGDLVTLGEVPDPQRFLDAGWKISESGGLRTSPHPIEWIPHPDAVDMTGGEGGEVIVRLDSLSEEDRRYLQGDDGS